MRQPSDVRGCETIDERLRQYGMSHHARPAVHRERFLLESESGAASGRSHPLTPAVRRAFRGENG